MLVELRVRDLGVIDDQTVVLGAGMTALTGETGAGKTLVVEAIDLLLGARADPVLVRPGATEATVEGRFVGPGGQERILGRVVPAAGRSRAYIDGRMATSAALAELGSELVDLHGQHAHQSLLSPPVQRAVLDAAGGVDAARLADAGARLRQLRAAAAASGGDARTRAREIDLLRFQLDELVGAALEDPGEDAALRDEEDRLGDAAAHREAAESLHHTVSGDDGLLDRLGAARARLGDRRALAELGARADGLLADIDELGRDARRAAETFEDDPARLAEIGARRRVLGDLRRKYGDTLGDVIAYRDETAARLDELESHEERAAALDARLRAAAAELAEAQAEVGRARRAAAGPLAAAVETRLRQLALPHARFQVEVSDDPAGATVTWLLAANPGEAAVALAKVASGGELARTMLAVRLVLGDVAGDAGPARTLVFDEVDAGIGGATAAVVGRALAAVGRHHQVLVVTHLPQVAAVADRHLVVDKAVRAGRARAEVRVAAGDDRVAEVSRMLSGRPDSATARRHASELLEGIGEGPDPSRSPAGPDQARGG